MSANGPLMCVNVFFVGYGVGGGAMSVNGVLRTLDFQR